jgi:hypothetical protein
MHAILAAEIIKAVDRERLTVRAAHKRTGIAAADFSRIRNARSLDGSFFRRLPASDCSEPQPGPIRRLPRSLLRTGYRPVRHRTPKPGLGRDEISGYGTARSLARQIGERDVATLLADTRTPA